MLTSRCHRTRPECGSSPSKARKRTVLPAPLGPITAKASPCWSVKETFWRTGRLSSVTERSSTFRTAWSVIGGGHSISYRYDSLFLAYYDGIEHAAKETRRAVLSGWRGRGHDAGIHPGFRDPDGGGVHRADRDTTAMARTTGLVAAVAISTGNIGISPCFGTHPRRSAPGPKILRLSDAVSGDRRRSHSKGDPLGGTWVGTGSRALFLVGAEAIL